jgi:branched-chain amino acid aminotransferase
MFFGKEGIMLKEKVDLDWENIGFGYKNTGKRYVSNYKNGEWDEGGLTEDATVHLSECACVLHYCQACFEGMKAYTTEKGKVVVFRPDLNAKRLVDSATRLEMPAFPEDRFIDAVVQTVKANLAYIPPYGTGASLYLRPIMFGTSEVLGVAPAKDCQFRIFGSPVGPYFKGKSDSLYLKVSDYDRAAPHGTGNIKAGLNYAMSLYPITKAHEEGYNENLYLDPMTRTYVEETGGANFFFVTKDNKVVTPKSESILPSITRRSIMTLAKDYLHLETEERPVKLEELKDFAECGLCGTAAVVAPVGRVNNHGEIITFENSQHGLGPISQKLYDTLTGIQFGRIEGPEGWILEIA